MLSLLVSSITGWRNDVRSQAGEHEQFIRDTYSIFLDIDRLQIQQPEISHEFVTPADYSEEVARVKRMFPNASPEQKAMMRLHEEAFAFYLFTCFERLVYAAKTPESTRAEALNRFLEKQLTYFYANVLRNPRLVYFWRDEKGFEYFDDYTRAEYNKHIPQNLSADPRGPFF